MKTEFIHQYLRSVNCFNENTRVFKTLEFSRILMLQDSRIVFSFENKAGNDT